MNAPRILVLLGGLAASIPALAAPIEHATSLPIPQLSAAALSPNGRWLAGQAGVRNKRQRGFVYDFQRHRGWNFDAGPLIKEPIISYRRYYDAFLVTWRPDSRAFALHTNDGVQVVWPDSHRFQRIWRGKNYEPGAQAWSPRSNKLAIFWDGGFPNSYRLWDGHRLSPSRDWPKAAGFPISSEAGAWDASWSLDEKSIALRFYGEADRGPEGAGHLFVFEPRTLREQWGNETALPQWLPGRRLIYEGDADAMGLDGQLHVTQIETKTSNVWLKNMAVWTLSPDHRTLWALTNNGDLVRTNTTHKAWEMVRRRVVSAENIGKAQAMKLSPNADIMALIPYEGRKDITLFSTSARHPWSKSWPTSPGTIKLLGWAQGQSLPLVSWQREYDSPLTIRQLQP